MEPSSRYEADVILKLAGGEKITAECKGGVINTAHPGQRSRLRRGLCEAVGQSLSRPAGNRQFALVPFADETEACARKLAPRARAAGIEIVLMRSNGTAILV